MRLFRALGALLLASIAFVAAKDEPDVTLSQFNSRPEIIYFFEDSETALIIDDGTQTVLRTTNAGHEWSKAEGPAEGMAAGIYLHPRDNKVAVVIGGEFTHWITEDQGKTWRSFKIEEFASLAEPITFHWNDGGRILFNALEDCRRATGCVGKTYVTTDGFRSRAQSLAVRRKTCSWVKSTELFTTGDEKKDKDRIICVVEGKFSNLQKDFKLLVSDDFFKSNHEPHISSGRTVPGIINIASVKSFIVVAAKAQGSKELALYVTRDTETWHRAEFGNHRVEEDAYTVLESTNYSIQVQVTPDQNVLKGVLFSSNSNGTYFTKLMDHVNRNRHGIMDFEKLQNIQGIFLVNEVTNGREIDEGGSNRKTIETKITFDDGRSFSNIKSGSENLHLHSVTELRNTGRVFSSAAPGIVMGNGNTGSYLKDIGDASLYISDDAGKTWMKASLEGLQKYEFGDQGSVLVAIRDGDFSEEINYSLNHGKTWKKVPLGKNIAPFELTTIPDSTSLKFIITGEDEERKWWSVAIDFNGLHERKCGSSDFEDWYARKDDKGNPQCLMGHKQHFRRRKADADCFIGEEFREALPEKVQCECSDEDFECDFNFRRTAEGKCEPVGRISDPEVQCKSRDGDFMGSSGWRLIPGNDCKPVGKQKDAPIKRPCSDAFVDPASGKIASTFNTHGGEKFMAMYYLERDAQASGNDETVVVLTDSFQAFKSHDHGKTWETAIKDADVDVVAIYPHQYNNDYVYFITPSEKVYYSVDRAHNVHSFKAPDIPNHKGIPILSFHQKNPDWILWTGNQDCDPRDRTNCHVEAHISQHNGAGAWRELMPWVKRCQFMYREDRPESEELVFCEHWQNEDVTGPLQLLSSGDLFKRYDPVFKDIVAFATMAEFIVVAAKTEDKKWLNAHASVDGKTFAHAAFPPRYEVEHQTAYTILDSSTNAVFMHVTENHDPNHEYGSILKSNTNGTLYVLSIRNVNRNRAGYVDWEKMQGLEGVAIVNIVDNVDEVKRSSTRKKLKTMISHDDGAFWAYLPCPDKDPEGQSYGCDSNNLAKKSLHLHGYTERKDPRETFSSPSAVGIMIGVGNVGEHLSPYNEGDTFLTKDGGITWRFIQKGTFMWEYGDQGSIIVLVKRDTPTSWILYSTDEGEFWKEYHFDEDGVMSVERITTVPSDNSRNFLLWGKKDGALTTVNLDFTGLTDKQCKLDRDHIEDPDSDYELWSPQHPHKKTHKECLFGHVSLYYRKKPSSLCYNGPMIERLHDISKNCTCTKEDFECDYNYEPTNDAENRCRLIEGFQPRAGLEMCKADPTLDEYYESSGYRRIPLSTCQGGRELDMVGEPKPCPGHEKQFEEHHRVSGTSLFFAIVIPVIAAAAVGYYAWTRWDGKFGRIRLGDGTGSGADLLSSDRPWIAWPVAAVSGLVAVIAALPLLASSLWRSASNRFGGYSGRTYTSRSSFARGRGDYASVDPDEGELLGDESDEEV